MENTVQKGLFLFRIFFTGMMFAFTSGMAAIPVIEKAIVDKKKWLTDEEFWQYPSLAQGLPGVISIHNSILIGSRIAGPFGALMAFLGTVTPPFICMLVIAALFQTVAENPYIQGVISGIRAVSVAIILGNCVRLLKTARRDWFSLLMAVFAVSVPLFLGFSTFWTILICAAAGILTVFFDPKPDSNPIKPSGRGEE